MTVAPAQIDLDACAREPIHIIGTIQSHGVLFAVSENDFIVRQVSANVETVLGMPPDTVLNTSLTSILGPQQFAVFETRLRSDDLSPASALQVTLGRHATEMNCVAHRLDDVLIIEFELREGLHALDAMELASNIQIMLTRMEQATTVLDYSDVAASEIQRVSGFDRVMVYRFDDEWNGEIISESIGRPIAEMWGTRPNSYLGLHFPASDIPVQARNLFLVNAVRAIADLDEAPVALVPQIGPLTGRPLDMTHTFLRSPSPIHVEYLRNMGVRASLAISILVDGRLWGMIACHHHLPRPIDSLTRSVCEMIAKNLSLQITLRNSNSLWHVQAAARKLIDDYRSNLEASDGRVDGTTLQDPLFLDLLDADGLIVCIDGIVTMQHATIPPEALLPMVAKLRSTVVRGIACSDRLHELDPSAASYTADVSGALYVDLGRRGSDYLLFVRGELIRTVQWAGNPDKAVDTDLDGRLHPRTSFLAWQQTVRGRARQWSELERESARFIREQLIHLRNADRLRALEALQNAEEL